MNLWIDGEWNDFGGPLISMALVSSAGHRWYEVLQCHNPTEWVKINVIANLEKLPIDRADMQKSLSVFLSQFSDICIIADWPEDIAQFCNLLILGPGMRMDTPPLTLRVDRKLNSDRSAVPHNALHDAIAMMEMDT